MLHSRKAPFSVFIAALLLALAACSSINKEKEELAAKMSSETSISFTKEKALEIVKTGFNAGDSYGEVWIRDYNTFIELSAEVFPAEVLKENLLVFFRLQGEDGNIVDGYIPAEKAGAGYDYIYSDLEPRYAGHKNTVETDQESSLIQTVYKYIQTTGDQSILDEEIGGRSVALRMEDALNFLLEERYSEKYGLLWGATTADWGDVQPEHDWGVFLTDDSHLCVDIYDNAMFLIAIENYIEMVPEKKASWSEVHKKFAANSREVLWDEENQKFYPHRYLDDSPFPDDFNEDQIFYHGGTAVAIEAGLLSKDEIQASLKQMKANVEAIGAGSIGLTLYPAYPEGFFKNKGMYPYGYQNGGDWTWFGARMIQQLIRYGFLTDGYEQLLPMTRRVEENKGFYEWYTIKNEPKGSGTFRGSAGVLYKAIEMLEDELK
jgi:glycogen debranching enzyme